MEEGNTNTNNDVNIWDASPTTQVAETPVAVETKTETQAEPVIEQTKETVEKTVEAPVAEKVVEVEKVVEKVIEKPIEFKSEKDRELYEAFTEGRHEDIKKYLDHKYKDFNTMSDIDVVKENLKISNPKWSEKDIEIEVKSKYGSLNKKDLSEIDADLDPDGYEKALKHNEAVEARELLLSRDARDSRIALEETKQNVELPKITSNQPEQPAKTQAEIDAENAEATRIWEEGVDANVPKLTDFKYTIDGEEVVYKVTDEDKNALKEQMRNFSAVDYLSKRGWFDKDGNPNILKITEDVYKLDNEDKLIKSVATQIKTATKKEVISKDIKNLDLDGKSALSPEVGVNAAEAFWN